MDVGDPVRRIEVWPVEEPVPAHEPAEEPTEPTRREREVEPERVPA